MYFPWSPIDFSVLDTDETNPSYWYYFQTFGAGCIYPAFFGTYAFILKKYL